MGGDQRHPLRPVCRDAETGDVSAGGLLNVFEELLRRLEGTRPHRWEGKRRAFRALRDGDAMFSLRSELVMAVLLIERGIPFEFGQEGRPQPDFVLTKFGMGIELGSRNIDGAQELEQAIVAALEADQLTYSVRLTYDYQPMMIRTAVKDAIVEQLRRGQPVDTELRPPDPRLGLPACRVRIEATPSDQIHISRAVADARLTWTMHDVVHEIRRSILDDERKLAQAQSMPTLLVVDLSRCSLAWIGSLAWRVQELADLLTPTDPYIGVGVMITGYERITPELALATNPHACTHDAQLMEQPQSRLQNDASRAAPTER
jgi:hypothetical protein